MNKSSEALDIIHKALGSLQLSKDDHTKLDGYVALIRSEINKDKDAKNDGRQSNTTSKKSGK